MTGKVIDHALLMPEGARTQEGYVWYVDAKNRLQRLQPEILYRAEGRIVVKAPEKAHSEIWQIAVNPLASFLPGQIVEPKSNASKSDGMNGEVR